jgi:hypothetical protein
MSTLAHRSFDDTHRPPLRLLERRPRPAPVAVEPPHPMDGWLTRWVDAYFAFGERLQSRHRMGSWERLR